MPPLGACPRPQGNAKAAAAAAAAKRKRQPDSDDEYAAASSDDDDFYDRQAPWRSFVAGLGGLAK
jgi:hypothetical protein